MSRRVIALFAALLASVLAVPLSAVPASADDGTVTWGVQPTDNEVGTGRPNFGYDAQPGGMLRDAIDVLNHSDEPLQLKVYASDAVTTAAGALDLLPAGETSTDVGAWITLDAATITVPADGVVSVPFTLTVPDDATPGDHTGGVVTSLINDDGDAQVSVDRRLGSRVLIRVAGELTPALTVSDVQVSYDGTLSPLAPGTAIVTYTVRNTGNVRLSAGQTVTVAGPFGLLGASVTPEDLPELLPGDSFSYRAEVPGVWPTVHLTAEVVLTPYATGSELPVEASEATGSAGTWAMPWGLLLVLVVVAALVWSALVLRHRRRAAVEAEIAAAVAQALEEAGTPAS